MRLYPRGFEFICMTFAIVFFGNFPEAFDERFNLHPTAAEMMRDRNYLSFSEDEKKLKEKNNFSF